MEYREISLIQLQKIQNAVMAKYDLEVPTYKVDLPGTSNKQEYEYDENSIKDAPEEDVNKWLAYQAELQKANEEASEKAMAYIFYQGVDCEISDEWLELQKWLEIDLPESKYDLKVMYVTTELLKTPKQIQNAMMEIIKLSSKGADPEAVKAAEDTFRGSIQSEED